MQSSSQETERDEGLPLHIHRHGILTLLVCSVFSKNQNHSNATSWVADRTTLLVAMILNFIDRFHEGKEKVDKLRYIANNSCLRCGSKRI